MLLLCVLFWVISNILLLAGAQLLTAADKANLDVGSVMVVFATLFSIFGGVCIVLGVYTSLLLFGHLIDILGGCIVCSYLDII